MGKLENKSYSDLRFYSGVLPSCEGLGPNWNYTFHKKFKLNADFEDEYILHLINDTSGEVISKVSTFPIMGQLICFLFDFQNSIPVQLNLNRI